MRLAVAVCLVLSLPSVLGATAPPEAFLGWGVHPGAHLVEPARCAVGFLMQHDDGRAGFLTAGHCVSAVGEVVTVANPTADRIEHAQRAVTAASGFATCPQIPGNWNPCIFHHYAETVGAAEGAADGGRAVGYVAAVEDGGIGNDFALVVLFEGERAGASPAIPSFGGPCSGPLPAEDVPRKVLGFRGNPATGRAPVDRIGIGEHTGAFRFYAPVAGGDSGSPALALPDRTAVGITTHATLLPASVRAEGQALEDIQARLPGWRVWLDPACSSS